MTKAQTVFSGARKATREEIDADARRLASWLASQGVGENDVVAGLLWNDFAFLSLPRACGLLGAYLVPLNWHLTRAELDYILNDCAAKVLVGHDVLLAQAGLEHSALLRVMAVPTPPEIARAYPKVQIADPQGNWSHWDDLTSLSEYDGAPLPGNRGGIFYTSGTTGNPKGVKRAPLGDDVWTRVRGRTLAAFGLAGGGAGHVALAPGPLYHSAPNAHTTNAWALGMDLILIPRFDAGATLDLMRAHQVSHAHMVPTMFSRLLALPEADRTLFDPRHLVAICHGAAPCPAPVKQAMIDWFGPVILEYYAGTETGIIGCSTSQDWLSRPGTIGRAAGECVVRVIDDAGRELPTGETGRLICHSDSTTSFTYHNREGSEQVDGWPGYVGLGDIGHVDEDGFIFLTDRSADIVISGGANIYPAEIEKELITLEGVGDCTVFGVPQPDLGEGVIALIEPADGHLLSEADLVAALRNRIAAYKIPRKFFVVESLPREDSGKIRKRDLREAYKEALSQ
ncbi:AMP-binding protein [Ruegeria pomeroyi]|nr:AMP-binding protein [Ruegeria pomeroyi]